MKTIFRKLTILCVSLAVTAVIGCKSDKIEDLLYGTEVSGTAAIGAPIVGTVNIKGANGKLSLSAIRADGSYTVDVSALDAPFVIFVQGHVGSKEVRLYSTIETPGRANVTPATNLAMTLALGADPESIYPPADMLVDGTIIESAPTKTDMDAAKTQVQELLSAVFATLDVPEGFDIMNGEFTADGSGFDKLLEAVKMDVDTSTGSTVVEISNATTGTVYYAENVETGIPTVDNTTNMVTEIAAASSDIDKIKLFYSEMIGYFLDTTSDDTTYAANMEKVYAEDYLKEGMNRADTIAEDLLDRKGDEMAGVTVTVKNVVIGEAIKDYEFAAATKVIASDIYVNGDINQGVLVSAGTYTFSAGTAAIGLGSNAKAVKVYYEIEFSKDGETSTEKGVDFFVQKTAGGDWKDWGDRSIIQNNDFGTRMNRVVSSKWVNSSSSWVESESIFSGYNTWCEDQGNSMESTYGITAILILGEGITAEYATGKKGILLMHQPFPSTQYRPVNTSVANNSNVYDETAGLNIAAITDPTLTIIGLSYNSGTKTFTPVRYWITNTDQGKPLSVTNGELTSAYFADFNFSSTDLADYTGTTEVPWVLPWSHAVSWAPPTLEGMMLDNVYTWMSGNKESSVTPGTVDTSSWINNGMDIDDSIITNNSFTYTVNSSDTLIFKLNTLNFQCSYQDESGRRFQSDYQINRQN